MKKTVKILTILLLVVMLVSFDDGGLAAKTGKIMGLIRNISVVASVIILMILGVKFMLGSVEEKAEYKKSFMPLIIGIILVVSATTIATFIFNMAK